MANRTLSPGDIVSGVLVDDVKGTPYVSASLIYDEKTGIRVEVAYIGDHDIDQFASCEKWFSQNEIPSNLLLMTQDGKISLFGCTAAGRQSTFSSGISIGRIRPSYVVMHERDGELQDPFAVEFCESQIDGLYEWTSITAVETVHETDENGRLKGVLIGVKSPKGISWMQDDATMTLDIDWSTSPSSSGVVVSESVVLRSTFSENRPVEDHISQQRKVLALLTLCFGYPVQFRRHRIKDEGFPDKALSGESVGVSYVEVYRRRSHRNKTHPKPEKRDLQRPFATIQEVGQPGLEKWSSNYDAWSRFIFPSISALNRQGAILENIVVNTCMGLEAAGSIFGKIPGEEQTTGRGGSATTATYMFRSVAQSGLDIQGIAESRTGLAKAIANNYNTIKHYGRGHFPDATETYYVGEISLIIARIIAVSLAGATAFFRLALDDIREEFADLDLYIDNQGSFVPRPK